MSVIVIGVDPGTSAGLAMLKDGKLVVAMQGTSSDVLTALEIMLSKFNDDDDWDAVTIACERYVQMHRGHQSHQPVAQQMVGVVESLAAKYNVKLVMQGPADARSIPNDLLKKLDMKVTARGIDAPDTNDVTMAIKHALLALAKHHASIFDGLVGQ